MSDPPCTSKEGQVTDAENRGCWQRFPDGRRLEPEGSVETRVSISCPASGCLVVDGSTGHHHSFVAFHPPL